MNGIIFNTIEEFNSLNTVLKDYVVNNFNRSFMTKWSEPILGLDGTYLMLGVDDIRLVNYDFTNYDIVEISEDNTNYFYE